MKINKKITFFYQSGRLEKIKYSENYAKEMFYGYHYFLEKYKDVQIVEFTIIKTKIRKFFRNYIEKKLSTIFKLPIYWSYLVTSKNNNILRESDYVVFNNNRVGASIIPLLIWNKIINKNIAKSLCFVLGLFSRTTKYKFLMPFHNYYIRLMLISIDKFVFLSEGEFNFAIKKFPRFVEKFHLLPFAVDLDVWKKQNVEKKEGIVFVGNDGFRDFEMVEKIVNSNPDLNFSIVSEFIDEKKLNQNNFKIYKGSWGHPALSDQELSNLYCKAKVTIIPLINSLQPSGQSVALQSIACGTPVIITSTDGFWDSKNFKHEKNIHFVNNQSLNDWDLEIKKVLSKDENLYKTLCDEGVKIIKNEYDLLEFSKKIEKIITL